MAREDLQKIVDKFEADAQFRAALRKDPRAAVTAAGFKLSDSEMQALIKAPWNRTDSQLIQLAKGSLGGRLTTEAGGPARTDFW